MRNIKYIGAGYLSEELDIDYKIGARLGIDYKITDNPLAPNFKE